MLGGRCRWVGLILASTLALAACTIKSAGTGAGSIPDAGGRGGAGGIGGTGPTAGSGGVSSDADANTPCGDLGERCCPAKPVSVCSTGACARSFCGVYGGAYQQLCGGSTKNCVHDPFTDDCVCPNAFSTSLIPLNLECDALADESDLDVCYAEQGDAGPGAAADWAGAYETGDGSPCGENPSCLVGNPYTGGACACPGAATPLSFPVNAVLSCNYVVPATVVFCVNKSAALATFGGAFEGGGSTQCYVPNSLTGSCTCKPGTTAEQFSVFKPVQGSAAIQTTLSICYRFSG